MSEPSPVDLLLSVDVGPRPEFDRGWAKGYAAGLDTAAELCGLARATIIGRRFITDWDDGRARILHDMAADIRAFRASAIQELRQEIKS